MHADVPDATEPDPAGLVEVAGAVAAAEARGLDADGELAETAVGADAAHPAVSAPAASSGIVSSAFFTRSPNTYVDPLLLISTTPQRALWLGVAVSRGADLLLPALVVVLLQRRDQRVTLSGHRGVQQQEMPRRTIGTIMTASSDFWLRHDSSSFAWEFGDNYPASVQNPTRYAPQGPKWVHRRLQRLPGRRNLHRPPVTETVEQPVVQTHRHTGRKGLLSSTSALRLTGVTESESKALLPFLLAHASPNYTVSFGWKPGNFVLSDNLATWHYAVNDYDGPRVYRKVIAG